MKRFQVLKYSVIKYYQPDNEICNMKTVFLGVPGTTQLKEGVA